MCVPSIVRVSGRLRCALQCGFLSEHPRVLVARTGRVVRQHLSKLLRCIGIGYRSGLSLLLDGSGLGSFRLLPLSKVKFTCHDRITFFQAYVCERPLSDRPTLMLVESLCFCVLLSWQHRCRKECSSPTQIRCREMRFQPKVAALSFIFAESD